MLIYRPMQSGSAIIRLFVGLILIAPWLSQSAEFKVLTYNIHHGRGMDGTIDLPRIAGVILKSGADIVALQEVDRMTERNNGVDTIYELSRLTGMAFVFSQNIPYQGGMYGNAFLSRYPVKDFSNHHYKMLREGEQRGMLMIRVALPGGQTASVWNTHLDYRSDPAERLLCIEQIKKLSESHPSGEPLILVGDFNTLPGKAAYQKAAGLWSDAWLLVHPEGDGFTFPSDGPQRRIDFQFIIGTEATVHPVEALVMNTEASDHLPLAVSYRFE